MNSVRAENSVNYVCKCWEKVAGVGRKKVGKNNFLGGRNILGVGEKSGKKSREKRV